MRNIQLNMPDINEFEYGDIITTEDGRRIMRIDGNIPLDLEVETGAHFLFISHDQSFLTHGLHKYPAKFFPELPRWIIQKFSDPGDLVLDPFAGSGTTNLEALLSGRNSVAVDVDPFAQLLAKVKVTPIKPEVLTTSFLWFKSRIPEFYKNVPKIEEFPKFHYIDTWFEKHVLEELTYLKKLIMALPSSDVKWLVNMDGEDMKNLTDFYLICFSSIIRAVSNADNRCTRTVVRKNMKKNIIPGETLNRFMSVLNKMVPKMGQFSRVCPPNYYVEIPKTGDARNIPYNTNIFDLAVTSPPYVNAVDYPRTHQLEIYWLGLEEGSLTPLKRKHVGTESVSHCDYKDLHYLQIPTADTVIGRVYKKDPRRAFILYKYLADMERNLVETLRVLKRGARYFVVVGGNQICGETIETPKYLLDIGERIGFEIEGYFASEIIRHFIRIPRKEQIKTEWVLILRKP